VNPVFALRGQRKFSESAIRGAPASGRDRLAPLHPRRAREDGTVDHDYYKKIRTQIHAWVEGKGATHKYAEYVLLAPDLVHLLVCLTLDDRVDTASKARLGAALAYFISPIDLMPEALLGPVGYMDDVAVACLALNSVLNKPGNREAAREHWQGDQDLLVVIQKVLAIASEMLGTRIWKSVQGKFGKK
jgi:uncharacterized membrane protein YkvA (DUF1232 family)